MLSWLFLNPPDGSINKWEKRIYVAAYAFGVLCVIGSLISSVIVFQNIVSTNLEMAFYPLAQILGLFTCLNIMAVGFFFRHRIIEVFNRLSEIYENRK